MEIRIPLSMWEAVLKEFDDRKPDEAMCIMLVKGIEALGKRIYIASRLITPSDDEAARGSYGVEPDESFLRPFYEWLKVDRVLESGYRVAVIHSHPFCSGSVRFSSIDHRSLRDDWKIIASEFGRDVEYLSIVLNQNGTSFDGYVQDRHGAHSIARIVVPGHMLNVIHREKPETLSHKELFSRMLLIPDYDLDRIAGLCIVLVGLGGLGSSILQDLLMLGIGEQGLTILVDPDTVEESNLSRIAYATFDDIGRPKVDVAQSYSKSVRPDREVMALQKKCFDVMDILAICDKVIGAVDRDAARYGLNHLAANCLTTYLDVSAGIIIDEIAGQQLVMSGGQVRLFVPEKSPCLLCNMGLDQTEIDKEWARGKLTRDEKKLLRKAGYLEDLLSTGTPQPSVYNLNQIMAGMATSTLLSYVLRGVDYDFVSLDLENLEVLKGKAEGNVLCPYCGEENCIGDAEIFSLENHLKASAIGDFPEPSYAGKISDRGDAGTAKEARDAIR